LVTGIPIGQFPINQEFTIIPGLVAIPGKNPLGKEGRKAVNSGNFFTLGYLGGKKV